MRNYLLEEYNKLGSPDLSKSGRCNILNNIVQIKIEEQGLMSERNHISVDVKMYFNSVIDLVDSERIGYDQIELSKIKVLLGNFELEDKIYYLTYFIRQLQKSSLENDTKSFQKLRSYYIIRKVISKRNNFTKFKTYKDLILYFPTYNLFTLFSTVLMVGIVVALILLPAPFNKLAILNFNIKYQNYTESFVVNHFVNIIGALIGIDSDFNIVAQDFLSVVVYILGKVFIFIYIISYLFNKLTEYLKL